VPLGGGRVAERRYDRIVLAPAAAAAAPSGEVPLAAPGETAFGAALVRCALAAAAGLEPSLAPALVVRAPRPGERLPGARRTIARMLLEARVPRSERARYPVVAAHGEAVALPGIAVARTLRRSPGLVLSVTPC
jgi:tRNA(Ile)-lysidine synthetase-like protein